jgi:hypothetical protein
LNEAKRKLTEISQWSYALLPFPFSKAAVNINEEAAPKSPEIGDIEPEMMEKAQSGKPKVYKLVFTGGPCGGKTTGQVGFLSLNPGFSLMFQLRLVWHHFLRDSDGKCLLFQKLLQFC